MTDGDRPLAERSQGAIFAKKQRRERGIERERNFFAKFTKKGEVYVNGGLGGG